MGDEKRGSVFATFVKKQFPKAKSILCVADGKGFVARSLANKGFNVKIIEPKARWQGRLHKKVVYEKGFFNREDKINADIVVAMHPDEATIEVIIAAKKQNKPFAIVPCCRKAMNANEIPSGGFSEWIDFLKKLGGKEVKEKFLKMTGKNTVLFRR